MVLPFDWHPACQLPVTPLLPNILLAHHLIPSPSPSHLHTVLDDSDEHGRDQQRGECTCT